jgi:peptide/nickel transport system substrate-binding protein
MSGHATMVRFITPRVRSGHPASLSRFPAGRLPGRPPAAPLAALALLLAALAPGPADAGSRPRYGGSLAISLPGVPVTTDPALAEDTADLFLTAQLHQPPLARDAAGRLVPVLLAKVPEPEDGGRTFRLELRPGLRFHDGTPITARDLADTLTRVGDGALRSPHAALVLPLAGLEVESPTTVVVRLAVPYPRWPEALAEPGLSVTTRGPGGGRVGCGPFAPADAEGGRLWAFPGHAEGRPFLDEVVPLYGRAGDVDLAPGTRPLLSTYLFVSRSRPDARALASRLDRALDREELVHTFVPGDAIPQSSLLPPPLDPSPTLGPGPRGPARLAPGPLVLIYDAAAPGHRAVAERIQLRLHEAGLETRLEAVTGAEIRERLTTRKYDLALARALSPRDPGLALATPLVLGGERETALLALRDRRLAGPDPEVARAAARSRAASFRGAVPVVPLYAVPVVAGVDADTPLHLPEDPAPLAPDLADAFLAPAPEAP